MVYRLTRNAANDIRRVYFESTRLFGREQARKYQLHLKNAFQTLGDNPFIARERPELMPPARIHPCGSHIIVYTYTAEDGVIILGVRHHRENWKPRER